jgi:hypothetical protein
VALLERPGRRVESPRDESDESRRLTERILRIGATVAVAGVVVQVVAQLVNYFVFDVQVWNLDVDADTNAFAWASSVAQFAAAFVCVLLAAVGWWSPRRLLALAAILAFFSLDDIARYHENLGSAVREDVVGAESGYGRLIWPIVFFPLLAAAFVLLWRLAERVYERSARFVELGLAMLVLAVLAEAASTVFHVGSDAEGTLPDVLEVAVEESLELAAWVLIAAALTATVCSVLYEKGRAAA